MNRSQGSRRRGYYCGTTERGFRECAICLQQVLGVANILVCNNSFHTQCLEKWAQTLAFKAFLISCPPVPEELVSVGPSHEAPVNDSLRSLVHYREMIPSRMRNDECQHVIEVYWRHHPSPSSSDALYHYMRYHVRNLSRKNCRRLFEAHLRRTNLRDLTPEEIEEFQASDQRCSQDCIQRQNGRNSQIEQYRRSQRHQRHQRFPRNHRRQRRY